MQISSKGQRIEPSQTLAISSEAASMREQGRDVISFGAGEPDFDTPRYIRKAAIEAINQGKTGYTATAGTGRLRRAIKHKFREDNHLEYSLDQIIVSNGAKHSLFNALQAIINPGDEVIIPIPYWVSYPELVKMADGKPVFVKTREKDNFKLKPASLNQSISEKTRAIILNNPGNPGGYVYEKKELEEIARIAKENRLVVISDEIYEHLVYKKATHHSFAALNPKIYDQTITINGMSKAFAMTGWRIGFAAGPEPVITAMKNIQSHSTSNANSIAQAASTTGLEERQKASKAISRMRREFNKRRKYVIRKIKKIPKLSCSIPRGAFYIMVNLRQLPEAELRDSFNFARKLLDNKLVAVVPGKAFGLDGFVRLSYATSLNNIKNGLERIEDFVTE